MKTASDFSSCNAFNFLIKVKKKKGGVVDLYLKAILLILFHLWVMYCDNFSKFFKSLVLIIWMHWIFYFLLDTMYTWVQKWFLCNMIDWKADNYICMHQHKPLLSYCRGLPAFMNDLAWFCCPRRIFTYEIKIIAYVALYLLNII